MSVLDISTTHANNAMLINVPDDGKTYVALFTMSRYSDNGNALAYVGVNIATAGGNSTTNTDLSVACYASMSGSTQIQFCVQNIKAGDVKVSTKALGSIAGSGGIYVNTIVSCMLSERVKSGSSGLPRLS